MVFLDSNVLLYAFTEGDPRSWRAKNLITEPFVISVQSLNEFIHVSRRKAKKEWFEIDRAIEQITLAAQSVRPIELPTQALAVALAQRYNFATYDAQIVASALEADCDTLYTEDMHHGLVIENRMTIRNPFV